MSNNGASITQIGPTAPAVTHKVIGKGKTTGRKAARKAGMAKQAKRQPGKPKWLAAAGVASVAMVLTGLSLSHLAHGIQYITHSQAWEGWAMAVGIDLNFVAMEAVSVLADDGTRKGVDKYATPAKILTLAGSAALNAYVFASQAENYWLMAAAIAMGAAIPALIYWATCCIGALRAPTA